MFKLALLCLEVELVVTEDFQDKTGDALKLLESLREDQDVIHVDADDPISNQLCKDIIHHCLECGRTVCQAKEHHQGLKQATVGAECSLPLISFMDSDIVVAPLNIKLGEIPGTFETLNQVINKG